MCSVVSLTVLAYYHASVTCCRTRQRMFRLMTLNDRWFWT